MGWSILHCPRNSRRFQCGERMNFKQFRRPANGHSRTAIMGGRVVGGRGFRLMSKIGQNAISLNRLEQLLAQAKQHGRKDGAT
jgi:hypothetical protein